MPFFIQFLTLMWTRMAWNLPAVIRSGSSSPFLLHTENGLSFDSEALTRTSPLASLLLKCPLWRNKRLLDRNRDRLAPKEAGNGLMKILEDWRQDIFNGSEAQGTNARAERAITGWGANSKGDLKAETALLQSCKAWRWTIPVLSIAHIGLLHGFNISMTLSSNCICFNHTSHISLSRKRIALEKDAKKWPQDLNFSLQSMKRASEESGFSPLQPEARFVEGIARSVHDSCNGEEQNCWWRRRRS